MKQLHFVGTVSVLFFQLGWLTYSLSHLEAQTRFPTNLPETKLNTLSSGEKSEGWKLLFDGKSLEGWEYDRGIWKVESGLIISQQGPGHLFTQKQYKNFELSWWACAYDIAVPKQRFGNSGVFLRGIKTGQAFPEGYEIQVDHYDVRNPTGGIYGMAQGALLVDESGNWKPEAFFDVHEGKWIHQKSLIMGNRIEVWVNGKKTLNWKDPKNRFPDAGYVVLQNHHQSDIVLFTNLKIRELGN